MDTQTKDTVRHATNRVHTTTSATCERVKRLREAHFFLATALPAVAQRALAEAERIERGDPSPDAPVSEPIIETHRVPMLDTGLGREAGYKDDAELIAVAQAERDALSPDARALVERIDADFERAVLFGEDAGARHG